jgi:hypothetical protein
MAIRATASKNYLMRLGLVGLFCLAGAVWFSYDGFVTYPARRARGLEYVKFMEERQDMEELARDEAWKKFAADQGWPIENPLDEDTGKPLKQYDINGQYIYAGVAGLAALGFLSRLGYMLGRWVDSNDEGLRNKAGQQARYADITQLDKKRWQSKGIAYVHYQSEGGAGRIRLDDFYYDRAPTRAILRQVEAHIDPAKIANGKPEPPEQPQ